MGAALTLARRGLGDVWPNPAVGCVLVRPDPAGGPGRVVGRGWTQPGGRPHAETEALGRAGAAARGTTAYVTLEPCSHHGQTPPCAESLIAAGVGRVVVAIEDPDPRVSGAGIAALRRAGIPVTLGPGAEEAAEINAGFFRRIKEERPLFTLKSATTLDGRIATHRGESQWITGEAARLLAQRLRAEHDAIMVGSGTALTDDPMLTCRLPGLEWRSPVRIVCDSRLRLPLTSRMVSSARHVSTWIVALENTAPERREVFADCGVEVIEAPPDDTGMPDLDWAAREFGRRGLTRVLVEGGSHLAAALLRRGLIDRLVWFRAPRLMGGDGVPAAQAFGVDRLADTPVFVRQEIRMAGPDLLETYHRKD
jgi:diaminohydroxyphosphoribosylaminopyrimidine deaminase/5-amino-6-(5-phosphoribosylamino)uracil reductase